MPLLSSGFGLLGVGRLQYAGCAIPVAVAAAVLQSGQRVRESGPAQRGAGNVKPRMECGWCPVGSASIVAAIRRGEEHPRRRWFGDATNGDAKGVGCLRSFVRLLFFLLLGCSWCFLGLLLRSRPFLCGSAFA